MLLNPTGIHAGLVLLDRCVRAAEHALAEVAQAVLDVVRKAVAIRDETDADDVQAVQLVASTRSGMCEPTSVFAPFVRYLKHC